MKKTKKKLVLSKETVADLAETDARRARGGNGISGYDTCPSEQMYPGPSYCWCG